MHPKKGKGQREERGRRQEGKSRGGWVGRGKASVVRRTNGPATNSSERAQSTIRRLGARRRTVATNFLRSDNVNKSRRGGAGRGRGGSAVGGVRRAIMTRKQATVVARRDRDNSWNYDKFPHFPAQDESAAVTTVAISRGPRCQPNTGQRPPRNPVSCYATRRRRLVWYLDVYPLSRTIAQDRPDDQSSSSSSSMIYSAPIIE